MNEGLSREEEYFISTFVFPNRRDRIRYELSSKKRRAECIWRFAHCARDVLRPDCIHSVFSKDGLLWLGPRRLSDVVHGHAVYLLYSDESLDKKTCTFDAAIDEFLGWGPYIMIDRDLTFAFVETESFSETHEYLFLRS